MDNVVLQMLEEYKCQSDLDYENALKEIMQEIALLGLWRAKFFEHGLFYGGTALRILHGLPRFSEDLDFSLLKKNSSFDLQPYFRAIKSELESFGFQVEIDAKNKNIKTQIESAFIKANTKTHLIKVITPAEISNRIQGNQFLKIKIELDTDPPGDFTPNIITLFRPIPFQVKTMVMEDLFAGKVHAVLAREWNNRVKGRDFYDYLWYLGRNTKLGLHHLEARLIQSGHWKQGEGLTDSKCKKLLLEKFKRLNVEKAKLDVFPYLKEREKASLDLWSNDFFIGTIERIIFLK